MVTIRVEGGSFLALTLEASRELEAGEQKRRQAE